ncbi:MAG TPA: FHA domain-containing protein, partial [Gemmatimonadaceae bacterium]|nr:FHA domain-containing protein [Gemmatimonadaceae bacterium]
LVSLVDGKEYSIPAGGITIGRDAASGVVVAQNEVSRKHAEVAPVEHGYEIRDFSANGVFVNGTRVNKAQILSRADVIRVGTEEFRFYADMAPVVKPSVATPPSAQPSVPATTAAPTVAAPAPAAPTIVPEARPVLAVLEITNEGPTKGQTYEICVPLAHVGRGAHNDVVINDDSVSDTHAKLQRRDDGWYLVDVGSTNGTYVAGQRLSAERRLDGAPDVRFGGVKAIFRARGAGVEHGAGTRAIASVDRAKLRETVATQAAAPAPTKASTATESPPSRGLPAWLWIVVALAVIGAAAFFLMNR